MLTNLLILAVLATADIKVGYSEESPPMTFLENSVPTGFDIKLLEEISKQNEWNIIYVPITMENRFDMLSGGDIDLLSGGVSIISTREQVFDFSTPYMDSGIGFADNAISRPSLIKTLWNNKSIWKSFLVLAIVIFVSGNIIWKLERGNGSSINEKYFPGIFDAFWYVWISLTTIGYGDLVAKSYIGRIAVFTFTVIGLGVAANVIAEINSFKIAKVESEISSASDISGLKIGIVANTATEKIAELLPDSIFVSYKSTDDLEPALLRNEVDVIAHDLPFIKYLCKEKQLTVLPVVLFEHRYGFMFRKGSELVKPTSVSILNLNESGKIKLIESEWF
jgi:ABC-type amino acid transport substrate-binding protein